MLRNPRQPNLAPTDPLSSMIRVLVPFELVRCVRMFAFIDLRACCNFYSGGPAGGVVLMTLRTVLDPIVLLASMNFGHERSGINLR